MAKKAEKDIVSVEMTLDRLEEDKAVLISELSECIIPIKLLPKSAKEGDIIIATFATDSAERNRREMKAKEILNEILNI
jgi:hypothetical protein